MLKRSIIYQLQLGNLLTIILAACLVVLTSALELKAEKFSVNDTVLFYDSENSDDEDNQEINWDDVEVFETLLRKDPNITVLHLESTGGLSSAAQYMADVVIDYELDTYVDGECSSACVQIFLGGKKRTLARGAWLGFHKSFWSSENMKSYYETEKEDEGWDNSFEFAEWVYADAQDTILKYFEYMLERGVSPAFAIKTLRADSDDMWYPRRAELVAGGVVNDTPQ